MDVIGRSLIWFFSRVDGWLRIDGKEVGKVVSFNFGKYWGINWSFGE